MPNPDSTPGDYEAQIRTLRSSAENLPHGRARIGLLEEAVRIADAHNDVPLGFECRQDLIQAATFGGSPDISMVAYAWCLAQADRDPEQYEEFQLLWRYKWIADQAAGYPQIRRQQIEEMLQDMETRFLRNNAGQHPVQQTVRCVALTMGNWEWAKAAHAKVQASAPTQLSDCPACEVDSQVDFYIKIGKPKVALKKAEPIFNGRSTCAEVPHRTYSRVLLALLEIGDPATAVDYHLKGFRLIGTNPKFISYAAHHVLFLTLTDNNAQAVKALERHLPNALETTCPEWRFDFYKAAVFLFDHLADIGYKLRLHLPQEADIPESVDRANPAALRDWFHAEARALAKRFDARNENDWFTRQLDQLPALKSRIAAYPLGGAS